MGHWSKKSERIFMTQIVSELIFQKYKRIELHDKLHNKCYICRTKLKLKQTHIDHIKPLASGGTNDDNNLQSLRNECHFEKKLKKNKIIMNM